MASVDGGFISFKTYRVRDIPPDLDVAGTRDLLASSLNTKPSNISVGSLAKGSNGRQEQVATVCFGDDFDRQRTKERFSIPVTRSNSITRDFLLLDTDFLGFTPLHTPAVNDEIPFE